MWKKCNSPLYSGAVMIGLPVNARSQYSSHMNGSTPALFPDQVDGEHKSIPSTIPVRILGCGFEGHGRECLSWDQCPICIAVYHYHAIENDIPDQRNAAQLEGLITGAMGHVKTLYPYARETLWVTLASWMVLLVVDCGLLIALFDRVPCFISYKYDRVGNVHWNVWRGIKYIVVGSST